MTDKQHTTAQPAKGHLLALDGVRGLAVLMVICSHAFTANHETHGGLFKIIGGLFYYGMYGVDLFFALSGFLITGILFDSLQDDGYFRKFYARRALRIFPLYYGVLLVCLLLTRPLHLDWQGMQWPFLLYLQNLYPAILTTFSAGPYVPLFHFWSLAIEEQFYLVWPALVFLLGSKRKLLWTTLIASGGTLLLRVGYLMHGGSPYFVHMSTVLRADSLLLGGALALLYRSPAWARVQRAAPAVLAILIAVMVASTLLLEPWLLATNLRALIFVTVTFYPTLLALGSCALIAWSLRPATLCGRMFQARWLRSLGKYSYGLYVLHVFVLAWVLAPLRYGIERATHSKLLGVAIGGVIALLASLLAAYASYHLYERPFLRLKHHFDYKRDSLNHGSPEDVPAALQAE
jgi:peptidoglycan/LPS O-acetylase OafA/YrhL